MLSDVITYLVCPHCTAGLRLDGRTVRCAHGHAFDVARQGYLNLLAGGPGRVGGDDAEMISARERFLAGDHFAPLADALAAAALQWSAGAAGCVVDLGAGTGYYLARALEELAGPGPPPPGLALDASPYAARRAARAHPRVGSVVCDTWRRLPVRDGAASMILNVFAPRNGAEIRRVLVPGGRLLVVTPRPRHLHELVGTLGLLTVDEDKQERLDTTLGPHLRMEDSRDLATTMTLRRSDVEALVKMGPSARHVPPSVLAQRTHRLPDVVSVTASVTLSTYRQV